MKYQQNQHFSHHHILINPLHLDHDDDTKNCNACEQEINQAPFHGCIKCKYYLHDSCFNTPRALNHPSHPSHPLTLHQTSTYFSRSFVCNACGSSGNGFTFSCANCEFDIHLHCANLPTSLSTDKHHHELKLFYGSPTDDENTVFSCDVCNEIMNLDHWLYYCDGCDFASHLDCVNGVKARHVLSREIRVHRGGAEAEKKVAQPGKYYSAGVEDLKAISEANDELYAAAIKGRIEAHTQKAALDLWGSSSDDDY